MPARTSSTTTWKRSARLYARVRPQANYQQSLDVLRFGKRYRPDVLTKSGLMVGLGEQESEVNELLADLAAQSMSMSRRSASICSRRAAT